MERRVKDIMEKEAYACHCGQTLSEVVQIFSAKGTSGLAVVDDGRHVVGFISDGDIMKAVAEQKTRSISCGGFASMMLYDNESFEEKAKALKHRTVMELAVKKVLCATADQPVGEIASVLGKKRFKKVPVVDEDGRLIGMVRRATIMQCLFGILFGDDEDPAADPRPGQPRPA